MMLTPSERSTHPCMANGLMEYPSNDNELRGLAAHSASFIARYPLSPDRMSRVPSAGVTYTICHMSNNQKLNKVNPSILLLYTLYTSWITMEVISVIIILLVVLITIVDFSN